MEPMNTFEKYDIGDAIEAAYAPYFFEDNAEEKIDAFYFLFVYFICRELISAEVKKNYLKISMI